MFDAVAWMNRYIGGYKIREVTPYIIQDFFDKLDSERYTTYTVTVFSILKILFISTRNTFAIQLAYSMLTDLPPIKCTREQVS